MTLLSAVAPAEETPVDRYLAEQADLTAVERFAQRHDAELVPRQARYYRDLIPLAAPGPGEQYAFEVDLDTCTGCKACVAACHSLNGLDDGESWRSVTLLTGTTAEPFQQTVTAACHHCLDPACLTGCPVDAYEKDPVTGIVSHLDDQCIGCSYCTLSCPYEVPVYNKARGIVRKCDMCRGRLAEGEAPACVQACPNGAIAVKVVDVATAVVGTTDRLVPTAPSSAITAPTTVYRTNRGMLPAAARSANAGPAHPHPSLAVMLVLTQLSVGAFIAAYVLGSAGPYDAALAVATATVAMAASVLHLGRPRYAYRAVIGLRHSWLSREVVAFGVFTALAAADAIVLWTRWLDGAALAALGAATCVAGAAGVACSVLIYTTTRRATWGPATVTAKFTLTAVVCGVAVVTWVSAIVASSSFGALLTVLAVLVAAKLLLEAAAGSPRHPDLRSTARARLLIGAVGGVVVPVLLGGGASLPRWAVLVLMSGVVGAVVLGELLERHLFFTASGPPA